MKTGDTLSRAALAKATRKTEDQTANPCLSWFRENVTDLVTHVPNEGFGTVRWRQALKARGLMKGASDWHFCPEYGPWAGRFGLIEWKREGSTWSDVTPEQRRYLRMAEDRGGLATWCQSREDMIAWCNRMGIVRPRGWILPIGRTVEEFGI